MKFKRHCVIPGKVTKYKVETEIVDLKKTFFYSTLLNVGKQQKKEWRLFDQVCHK